MTFARAAGILAMTGAGLLLFLFLTLLFIPGDALLTAINRGIAQHGLKLDAASFGKALPIGISAKGISLSSDSGELVKIDRGRLTLEIMPLLLGRVSLAIKADIGPGTVVATLSLLRNPSTSIDIKNVRLEDIPFFKTAAGMKAAGVLSAKAETAGKLANAKGFLQLQVQGVDLSGIKIGEMPLPDASYRTVQGMIRITEGKGSIESFTLQGDDLYVRLKGALPLMDPLPATPLNLSLELMPKAALLERQKLVFLLLVKFQDTPGHYQIPVKGTLGKPQVL
jgi:type II secretion system protein N